jgi:hypothetical protein
MRRKIFYGCAGLAALVVIAGIVGEKRDDSKPRQLTDQEKAIAATALAERTAADQKTAALAHKTTPAERKRYVEELEKGFLARGMDVELKVSGRDNTTLTMRYVFVNRPFVYQMMNDPLVFASKQADGFTKIVFTDGYFKTWTCDLARRDCR